MTATIKTRLARLESAPALKGASDLREAERLSEEQNLAAVRTRCTMMLGVSGSPGERAEVQELIDAIDAGTYRPGERAANVDERAKCSHAILAAMVED